MTDGLAVAAVPERSEVSQLRVVVVGCGSIGRRHIRNLKSLGVGSITAVDNDEESVRSVVDESGVSASDFPVALADKPDVVCVCTPPFLHVEQAIAAVEAGAHVFVEKPLAKDLSSADELLRVAEKSDRVVEVGYNLRHISNVRLMRERAASGFYGRPLWARFEIGQYLPDWRPTRDYRTNYTAISEMGGGIILDASHEVDLAMWFLGKPVELCCMAGKVSDLEMDVEDTATLLVRFENGAQADIHLDCIQRKYSRGLKIAFENGTLEWSFPEDQVREYLVDGEATEFGPREEPNQMYVNEMTDFLSNVVNGRRTNSLFESREVLKVALAARDAAANRKWVELG